MANFGGIYPSAQSQQTQMTMVPRVLNFRQGNGYQQIAPDGPNSMIEQWQITWDALGAANSTTLQAWLVANPPTVTFVGDGVLLSASKTYHMTLDGWQKQPMSGGVNQFTTNIEEWF
jgi:phage-related protein